MRSLTTCPWLSSKFASSVVWLRALGVAALNSWIDQRATVTIDQVALRLNQRPRKTLGFETPASKLQASVASTV